MIIFTILLLVICVLICESIQLTRKPLIEGRIAYRDLNWKVIPDIWDSFSELLFKQPEFHGLEGSSNSIREKYKENQEKQHLVK
jgi:hypothetical protein